MAKLTKKKRDEVIELLLKEYPDAKCALDYDTPYHLLVAVMLSAQTTDVAVNLATPKLFKAAPDAFAMAKLKQEKLEEYIRKIGLYRSKAKNVLEMSKILCRDYNGEIPKTFEELVALPGVGRKTANVVLAEIYKVPTIAVDTHVFRLANRIGFCNEDDVVKTEEALKRVIPKDQWIKMHHALIWHGRRVCIARNPHCSECCLKDICKGKVE